MEGLKYSNAQRLAFLALLVGFLMCAISGGTPYWKKAEVTPNNIASIFGESIPFVGNIELAKFEGGLIWFCVDSAFSEKECRIYKLSDDTGSMDVVSLGTYAAGLLLSLACVFGACCRVCCCDGGKTICHGVMAFFAGGLLVATGIMFAVSSEDGWGMKLKLVKYAWAFYVYFAGSALIILSSFILCCAYPESPILAMVPQRVAQPVALIVSSHHGYNHLHEDANSMHPMLPQQQQQAGAWMNQGQQPGNMHGHATTAAYA